MLHKKEDWVLVRGGKYTNDNKSYIFPEKTLGKEIPICKCGFPCDIRHHKDNYLYFRCAKKNIWEHIKDKFDRINTINVNINHFTDSRNIW